MGSLVTAIEFLNKHLPENIKGIIDYESLRVEPTDLIDEKLKEKITDILYSVNFNKDKGYIYVVIEHQNKPEKLMPFRILQYMISIMERHLVNTKSDELPVVYPIIFYAGVKKYKYSTYLFDLFGKYCELAFNIFTNPYCLINVHNMADEAFDKLLFYGTMAKTMKYVQLFKDNIENLLAKIKNDLEELENKGYLSYIYRTISYCYAVGNIKNREDLYSILTKNFSKNLGDQIMSYADELRNERRNEGRNEGKNAGRAEGFSLGVSSAMEKVAKGLLQRNTDLKYIMEITGLTEKEIKLILSELDINPE